MRKFKFHTNTQRKGPNTRTKAVTLAGEHTSSRLTGACKHMHSIHFSLGKRQRLNLPRCRVLLQFKGLSGGLPQWRAAYDDAGNCELSQSETHNSHNLYWQHNGQSKVFELHQALFVKCMNSEALLKMHLLWSWVLTAFQYPGESVRQRRTTAPLCRELVQSAYISAANVLVQCVC